MPITLDPNLVYRRYETDGVPESGPHQVDKGEAAQLLTEMIDEFGGDPSGIFSEPIYTNAVGATRLGILEWNTAASGQTWGGFYFDAALQRLMIGALTGGGAHRAVQMGYESNSQVMIGAVPAPLGDPVQDAKLEVASPLNQRAFRSLTTQTKNSAPNDINTVFHRFDDNPGNDASAFRVVQFVRGNNEGYPHTGRAFLSRPVEFHGVVNQGVGNAPNNSMWSAELSLSSETGGNTFDKSVVLHIMEMGQTWGLANRLAIDCGIVIKSETGMGWFERYHDQTSNLKFAVRGDGQIFTDANITTGGADYAEMFEWADGNPDAEDRTGRSVALASDGKIVIAGEGDTPIGVVSARPTVIGDNSLNWHGKYLVDDFGRPTVELNPAYVPNKGDYEPYRSPKDKQRASLRSQMVASIPAGASDDERDKCLSAIAMEVENRLATIEELPPHYVFSLDRASTITPEQYEALPDRYVPRDHRPEWAAVGLMGKLRIRKDEVIGDRWHKLRDVSTEVEEWLVR